MDLTPNVTTLVQVAMFFVLMPILGKVLFAPFLEVLDERASRTSGDIEDAQRSRAEVDALSAQVDAELAKARALAMSEVEAVRRKTKEEARALFDQAQAEAAGRLSELRGGIAKATAEARTALVADARSIADQMVNAVLGRGGMA